MACLDCSDTPLVKGKMADRTKATCPDCGTAWQYLDSMRSWHRFELNGDTANALRMTVKDTVDELLGFTRRKATRNPGFALHEDTGKPVYTCVACERSAFRAIYCQFVTGIVKIPIEKTDPETGETVITRISIPKYDRGFVCYPCQAESVRETRIGPQKRYTPCPAREIGRVTR